MQCSSCRREIFETSRFCAQCGAPVADPDGATFTAPVVSPRPPSKEPMDHARFIPGTMLVNRYRIVSLIGRGGMGEVYRAEDLKLGQQVALKFLPEEFARNTDRLERFHQEVRVARQVSHPNVCRVYDIGEADGQHFLSMEYVDGEDLASLLRRIGRLPGDKALQVARQLCAGLAAAHDRDVLHRDLKPANVLIDGRGRVRIADFGLAALAEEGREIRMAAGTPAYMAPEQRDGRGASMRSDVYALGLVLYEIFTGKPALTGVGVSPGRSSTDSRPTNLSNIVPEIDPVIERVVLRCLEQDPVQRPASALAVAAALPGGDPLAAALAAGETPSPDIVAAAGEVGVLSPAVGLACLVAVLLGLVPVPWMSQQTGLMRYVNAERAPAVLADRAVEIARTLGHVDRPLDSASGYAVDSEQLRFVASRDRSGPSSPSLATNRPSPLSFWYRQSPEALEPGSFGGTRVTPQDPSLTVPGMLLVETDPAGFLTRFVAVPPRFERSAPETHPPDWAVMFKEAGLDLTRFSAAASRRAPPVYADTRAAWIGTYPDRPKIPIHVEAAAAFGKPVYFEIVPPWRDVGTPSLAAPFTDTLTTAPALPALVVLLLLTRHNLRVGRGDRRGALRLFVCYGAGALLGLTLEAENIATLARNLPVVVYRALVVWLAYLALEPHLRRLWPESMIALSRLLAGRLRDPLVGRDVILGSVAGVLVTFVSQFSRITSDWLQAGEVTLVVPPSDSLLLAGRWALSAIVGVFTGNVALGLFFVFVLVVLHLLLRYRSLAVAGLFLLLMAIGPLPILGEGPLALRILFAAMFSGAIVVVLLRFGLLATIVCGIVSRFTTLNPISLDSSVFYSSSSYFILATVIALAAYGFRTALAGRPVFGPGFWGDAPAERA
jgi:serine/threonine-protein kinase